MKAFHNQILQNQLRLKRLWRQKVPRAAEDMQFAYCTHSAAIFDWKRDIFGVKGMKRNSERYADI